MNEEPKFHSHIEDRLPDDHPLAWTCVVCVRCGEMVHATNNECMQAWMETGKGAYCLTDFRNLWADGCPPDPDEDGWALQSEPARFKGAK